MPTAADAYAAVEPELVALPADQLVVVNVDVPTVVSLVLGALPGIRPMRAHMVRLPDFDVAYLDKLETYALAAWYAHLLSLPAPGADNPVRVLLDEAAPLRANLLADAEALARRGLLDGPTVAEIRSGSGNVDTANDLVALSSLFRQSWHSVQHKTAATDAEVQRAGELGPLLLAALGLRVHGPAPAPVDVLDRRRRAFTLLARAYDQVRRAVSYLRWAEGDADLLAPSLYKGRGGRGHAEDDGEATDEAATGDAETKPAGEAKPKDEAKPKAKGKAAAPEAKTAAPEAKPVDSPPVTDGAAEAAGDAAPQNNSGA